MSSKIDQFFKSISKWGKELQALRTIMLDCGLDEVYKWRQPCYTYQGKNILILANFKNHCAIGFFKGVHLSDEKQLLTKPGEFSQEGRQFRFTNLKEIVALENYIKQSVFEAIEIEKAKIKLDLTVAKLESPEEVENYFKKYPTVKKAFEQLTPGRQRAYNIFFLGAKQSATRTVRIAKMADRILKGYGMNDCTCGQSKRMPNCDGSHKYISQ